MRFDDKARELVRHFQSIKARVHGADKNIAAVCRILSVQEAHVLLSLGSEALTVGEVAARIQLSVSSASGLIDKLERKGLARRRRGDEDRRSVRVEPTAAGRRLRTLAEETHLKMTRSLLSALSVREQDLLLGLFRKISQKHEAQ